MANYGKTETWKITYYPKVLNAGTRGVALIEADTRHMAMYTFQQQYAGQYSAVERCEKLFS
jgi:hypothetical protein